MHSQQQHGRNCAQPCHRLRQWGPGTWTPYTQGSNEIHVKLGAFDQRAPRHRLCCFFLSPACSPQGLLQVPYLQGALRLLWEKPVSEMTKKTGVRAPRDLTQQAGLKITFILCCIHRPVSLSRSSEGLGADQDQQWPARQLSSATVPEASRAVSEVATTFRGSPGHQAHS